MASERRRQGEGEEAVLGPAKKMTRALGVRNDVRDRPCEPRDEGVCVPHCVDGFPATATAYVTSSSHAWIVRSKARASVSQSPNPLSACNRMR